MTLTRRRMIGIVAAATALPCPALGRTASDTTWRGQALGAEASITLVHSEPRRAAAALSACRSEIRRLESTFSLFRRDSAIVRLNRLGRLDDAPDEMIELLAIARRLSDLSDGAFDITVQPLWQAFSSGGDCHQRAAATLDLVDWRLVDVGGRDVRLARPGMAITLNGIAQGYITDRVADQLRAHGFDQVLVNMGEFFGFGRRADGAPWRIGIGHPDGRGLLDEIDLQNQAIATSSPVGTPFVCPRGGAAHHLFDPKTGGPAAGWRSVSVIADRAVIADGLSTAIAVAEPARAKRLLDEGGGERAILSTSDGRRTAFHSGSV